MRTAKREVKKTTDTRGITSYHAGDGRCSNYAQAGYGEARYYYSSDRKIALVQSENGDWVRPDGKPAKGYGLEIEMANNVITSEHVAVNVLRSMVLNHVEPDLFKLQKDGSLSGHTSAEAITQVISKEALRNMYPRFKRMWDENMPATGWDTNNSCGMHVNISLGNFGRDEKTQFDAAKKLCYWVNKNFAIACRLFNRNANCTSYCSRSVNFSSVDYMKTLTIQQARAFNSNHYICFNWGHVGERPATARVELRLVGPQDNYIRFRNTMECVFHLVDACKSLSWAAMDDIKAVFSGCNKYVVQRLGDACRDGLIDMDTYEYISANRDSSVNFEVNLA